MGKALAANADTAPSFLKQKDYAQHRGVLPSAVSNWKKEGLLVMGSTAQTCRLVDVLASDTRLGEARDPLRGRPPTAPIAIDPAAIARSQVAEVRTDLLREQTIKARLENAQAAGVLVPLIECERRITEIGRLARERMKATLRAEAERLAVETNRRTILLVCDDCVDRAFAELAEDVEAGIIDDQGEDQEPEENHSDAGDC